MNRLRPQVPFVWPDSRVLSGINTYEKEPPYGEMAERSRAVFGVVSAITKAGIGIVESWLNGNPDFIARLVVTVYPTCATSKPDLSQLVQLVERSSGRLCVHVLALERLADRAANALCFLATDSDEAEIVVGPTEDLGFASRHLGAVNFVFQADPVLRQEFGRYFDFLWASSRVVTSDGVVQIPDLVVPPGTAEATRLWRGYMLDCTETQHVTDEPPVVAEEPTSVADAAILSYDVAIELDKRPKATRPTEELGLPKLDELTEWLARLYDKGVVVSVDKLSRIPPLDAPLDPSIFGDSAELQKGKITRRVTMRVSIIDEKTLKEIEKRRQGLRLLLAKFTFGLADNMRWMPLSAQALFKEELDRLNKEGQGLIANLLEGDVDKFVKSRHDALVADINAMYRELNPGVSAPDHVIVGVENGLKERLSAAQTASFMPKPSYSKLVFDTTSNHLVSPWGQASSLLADIARFPRKALTDKFFFSGLKVSEDPLIDAMNVADDALCRERFSRGVKDRCISELEIITRIDKPSVDSRTRCALLFRVLQGDSMRAIEAELNKVESS